MMGGCCWQGGPGSQAQVLISTRPGASNADVQSIVGTLATAASSGQLLYDLKAAGACTCPLSRPSASCLLPDAHDVSTML